MDDIPQQYDQRHGANDSEPASNVAKRHRVQHNHVRGQHLGGVRHRRVYASSKHFYRFGSGQSHGLGDRAQLDPIYQLERRQYDGVARPRDSYWFYRFRSEQ